WFPVPMHEVVPGEPRRPSTHGLDETLLHRDGGRDRNIVSSGQIVFVGGGDMTGVHSAVAPPRPGERARIQGVDPDLHRSLLQPATRPRNASSRPVWSSARSASGMWPQSSTATNSVPGYRGTRSCQASTGVIRSYRPHTYSDGHRTLSNPD